MEDVEGTAPESSAVRAATWAVVFGGGGVLLVAVVLGGGFAVVLLLMAHFLRVLGEPGLHRLFDAGGDAALQNLLLAHLGLLGGGGALCAGIAWLVLALLRRSAAVRRWWPSAQGLLAAGTAYALVAGVAILAVVSRGFAG